MADLKSELLRVYEQLPYSLVLLKRKEFVGESGGGSDKLPYSLVLLKHYSDLEQEEKKDRLILPYSLVLLKHNRRNKERVG